MTELRCGNDRLWTAWTAEENQKQVSPSAHSPWKSLRDSHIPAATTHDRSGKVEIQHQDFPFSTAHPSLSIPKMKRDHSRLIP